MNPQRTTRILAALESAQTDQEAYEAIAFAVAAWNASYLPDDAWRRSLMNYSKMAFDSPKAVCDSEGLMWAMVDLKRALYAHEDRIVREFELTFNRGHLNLRVISTSREGPPPPWSIAPPADDPRSEQLEFDLAES
jgi:hypothetical protein